VELDDPNPDIRNSKLCLRHPVTKTTDSATPVRAPIREGLLSGPLSDIDSVRLTGSKCTSCGETSLGSRTICPNCGCDTVQDVALSDRGVLWTFTVVRHRPPGNYKGPDPFVPFGMGLVELPDGVRVLSPIHCDIDRLKIGLKLRFTPYVRRDDDGREVVAFTFKPESNGGAHV
jgi:uncharacterized OB-fold protein